MILGCVICAPGAVQACLLPEGDAAPLPATGEELISPIRYLAAVGGDVALPCADAPMNLPRGFAAQVSAHPDAVFDLSGMSGRILAVRAFAECPVRLIVNTGQGVWMTGGPLAIPAEATHGEELYIWGPGNGTLRVWLGAEDAEGCPAEIELETYDQ